MRSEPRPNRGGGGGVVVTSCHQLGDFSRLNSVGGALVWRSHLMKLPEYKYTHMHAVQRADVGGDGDAICVHVDLVASMHPLMRPGRGF